MGCGNHPCFFYYECRKCIFLHISLYSLERIWDKSIYKEMVGWYIFISKTAFARMVTFSARKYSNNSVLKKKDDLPSLHILHRRFPYETIVQNLAKYPILAVCWVDVIINLLIAKIAEGRLFLNLPLSFFHNSLRF